MNQEKFCKPRDLLQTRGTVKKTRELLQTRGTVTNQEVLQTKKTVENQGESWRNIIQSSIFDISFMLYFAIVNNVIWTHTSNYNASP